MDVHVIQDDKIVAVPKEEWGHFFGDELYLIDLKGKNHRYITMWMGPKLSPEEYTNTSR